MDDLFRLRFPPAIALQGGRLDFGVDGTALAQAGALAMRLTPTVWGMVGAIFQRKGRKGRKGHTRHEGPR